MACPGLNTQRAPVMFSNSSEGHVSGGVDVAVEAQDRTGLLVDPDDGLGGGAGDGLSRPRGYVRRHGMRGELRALAADYRRFPEQIAGWFMKQDIPLVGASFLVVGGLIFNIVAAVAFSYGSDMGRAWTTGAIGTALWILAAGLWYFFLSDPQPRHSKKR